MEKSSEQKGGAGDGGEGERPIDEPQESRVLKGTATGGEERSRTKRSRKDKGRGLGRGKALKRWRTWSHGVRRVPTTYGVPPSVLTTRKQTAWRRAGRRQVRSTAAAAQPLPTLLSCIVKVLPDSQIRRNFLSEPPATAGRRHVAS
ncbi:hypothetical protein E2C01_013619 [Portunus trituberculatus]|uniref:Uncharacterized protein n=1 Tax=Portunus trituberculatus TaxID=210409 RepID=A0A5B7DHU8_PORTR|nr:hypothetical protein [Portunus trituberculatus]